MTARSRSAPVTTSTALNDQHAYLGCPEESPLAVGDLVACGISHPCTTFDKWQVVYVVDDDYHGRRRGEDVLLTRRQRMRVFTASLATETNTFSPIPTDLAAFKESFYAPPGSIRRRRRCAAPRWSSPAAAPARKASR